jgi:hypothetical protein
VVVFVVQKLEKDQKSMPTKAWHSGTNDRQNDRSGFQGIQRRPQRVRLQTFALQDFGVVGKCKVTVLPIFTLASKLVPIRTMHRWLVQGLAALETMLEATTPRLRCMKPMTVGQLILEAVKIGECSKDSLLHALMGIAGNLDRRFQEHNEYTIIDHNESDLHS